MKCESCPVTHDCWASTPSRSRICELARDRDDYRKLVVDRSQGFVANSPRDSAHPPPPGRRVVIQTFFNSFSGFGRFAWKIGAALESIGVPVVYDAKGTDTRYAQVDPWQIERHRPGAIDPWRLLLDYRSGGIGQDCPYRYVYYTMHETTRCHPPLVGRCNQAHAVIVPSRWNARTFVESGVRRPIHVCPLGYDPGEGWSPSQRPRDGKFRVIMVGMLPHGGIRKMFGLGIKAFRAAFWGRQDVELHIKIWPECRSLLEVPDDPRIKVYPESWPIARLVELVQSADAFLHPSASEGWGLPMLEAMACGVPPITTLATAHSAFVTPDCAWTVRHRSEPASGYYHGQGDWYPPRFDDLVSALVRARANPDFNRAKGDAAAEQAKRFTWRQSAIALRSILWDVGLLAKRDKPRVPLDRRQCVPCQGADRFPSPAPSVPLPPAVAERR